MKALICMSLAVCLLLAACGGTSPSAPEASVSPTASPSVEPTPTPQSSPQSSPSTEASPSPEVSGLEPEPDRLLEVLGPDASWSFFDRIDGSTATIPLSEAIAGKLLGVGPEEAVTYILHNKTHSAYMNLIDGEKDIIFVTYPSEDELQSAKDAGVELEVVEVVKDAFVFLANSANPVKSLTQKQLKDIYTGKLTNWKSVGGEDREITAFQRPNNSGSQTLMYKYVVPEKSIMEAPKELRPAEMEGLVDVISDYDNAEGAIGYSVFYYANDMYLREETRLLGVDGVLPSRETLKDGSYPYISYYYAVLRKASPEDSPERRLLSWLLGPEGQAVAEEAGYVALK